jgi:molybdopterin-dependent oxidoreductase alpha subunit
MAARRRLWNPFWNPLSVLKWRPSTWAGLTPNGIGKVKPNHYWEMTKIVWKNRKELPYSWRILTKGVCDGCALGTTGMHDFTMDGIHLCTVRLNLLSLNTMGPLDTGLLEDVSQIERMNATELRELGRLPYPMVRRKGEKGFARVPWDAAYDLIAGRIRTTDPDRLAFYLTSRGITNEVYYLAQKAARFLGTNNVDNSARVCHASSTTGLKQALGVAASTCSYKDWIGADLLVFFGSDVPNNQPVTTKYIYEAKRQGAKVLVVNPYKEPGLERYWVPSLMESAVFGTKIADEFFQIHTGGDIAFINGVLKHLIENGWLDEAFVREHTSGFEEMKAALAQQSWAALENSSGASRETMLRFAQLYSQAKSAVFVWSMGITQHRYGVDNVRSIVNLALARGMLGREKTGLMAIRGHSGVQGGAEVGCTPWNLPGGDAVSPESAARLSEVWGFPVPDKMGYTAVEMIDAAARGDIDMLWSAGGNFLETLPEPDFVREALERVPLRVHQDIVVTPQMLVDPADVVVLLPARTRYEQRGGGTETSTERRIYFSPEIPGRRIGESKSEWEIFMELAERVYPQRKAQIHFDSGDAIRKEIAKTVPLYAGIEEFKQPGDVVQWGGPMLCAGGVANTPDGRGKFAAVQPPEEALPTGMFLMSTRRGKQFNSMVHSKRDPLTGATREDVLLSAEDAQRLGLRDGDAVVVRNEVGAFHGKAKIVPIKARNIQLHWPESNHLIKRGQCDPLCGIPDYNAFVEVVGEEKEADRAG